MVTATVTSKGQITIPKSVRNSLGLKEGDRVEFEVRDDEALLKPVTRRVDEVFGRLHRPGRVALTTAQMDAAVRQRWPERRP